MYDCRYWLWLSQAFEPGSVKCDKLLHSFDHNPKAIYEADANALAHFCEKSPRLLAALTNKSLDQVYKTLDFCEKNNVGILTYDDEKYPRSLYRIQGQPTVIYYKGKIPDFSKRLTVSIVGTRQVTPYGSSTAYTISHDLASAGAIVVSGMATGSDTAAHRGALDARGTTVAFLGCGINVVYPKENARLMEEIIESGAVMTDYPPFARPEGRHFPVRNRLISGVSNGVLVIEAAKKSGALITAEHARNQGKLIYAIPGRIGELASEGTNSLLSSGAKTVTKAGDILDDFRHLFDIKERSNPSGHTQFRTAPLDDLSVPYRTPVFNAQAKAVSSGYPEHPHHEEHYSKPISNVNVSAYDDDRARAYMSLSTDEVVHREVVKETKSVPGVPNVPGASGVRSAPIAPPQVPKPTADYDGLSDNEVAVLKAIEKRGKASVDTLGDVGIPISAILATITLLEIKHRIVQLPGGYFEIKRRS